MIRQTTTADAKAITEIYNHYILNSTITFEEETLDQQTIEGRINSSGKMLWWVFEEEK
jgi:phosphinothricin acetyltransferase